MKTIKNLKAEEIRKSILQLAIQGKLVKQDPNDEPASELVKRIYAEKQRLIKEGKIKKDKNESFIFKGDDNCYYEKIGNSEPVKLEDLPFDIPDSWTWIRLKNISEYGMGQTILTKEMSNEGTPVFSATIDDKPLGFIPESDNKIKLTIDDLVIPARGNSIGYVTHIKDETASCTQTTIWMKLYDKEIVNFLLCFFKGYKDKLFIFSGGAIPQVTITMMKNYLMPLPPIQEQVRIANKINLFAPLLEKYGITEENLSKLEETFPEKLKKSILQYAIEGKLVKQDPNDEPASVLLKRIKAEKEKLVKEGKIKRDKNESYIYQGDDKNYYENFLFYYHSFDIPSGWEICKLAEITEFIHRGKSPVYSSIEEIPVIAQKCNQKDGSLSLEKALFIDPASLCKYDKTKISKPNDIIVNSTGTGTVGRVNILNTSLFEKYQTIVTDSHVTTIRLIENECDPLFIYFYLKSPLIYDHAEERSEGSTNQIELYAKTIMNYCLCLPPKNEQTRISRKISRLLSHL